MVRLTNQDPRLVSAPGYVPASSIGPLAEQFQRAASAAGNLVQWPVGGPSLSLELPLRGSRNQRTYDDLQVLFLMRLVRILKLRQEFGGRLSERDARYRLMDSAFRSTMGDCEALGLGPEARALLETD